MADFAFAICFFNSSHFFLDEKVSKKSRLHNILLKFITNQAW
jgi:hypothetical protein